MSKLFEQGIEAVKDLPPDRQDLAGELLLRLAASGLQYRLTPEQVKDLKESIAEADRGEFSTDKEMIAAWAKFGSRSYATRRGRVGILRISRNS